MNIDEKIAHYLCNSWIDFQTFYILDIIPQNKDDAVIILAPLHPEEDPVFSYGIRERGIRISRLSE